MKIEVGPDYPVAPPTITFATKVFHPNVNFETGEICLDILKREWTPAWNLEVNLDTPFFFSSTYNVKKWITAFVKAACRAIIALMALPDIDRYEISIVNISFLSFSI